ncbi:MAG TPA: VWA domain-containing protein [Candidatus Acidoferrum sp.]|nr:VWA domain-containing protein [Candidatus Acidoferrum sp.]
MVLTIVCRAQSQLAFRSTVELVVVPVTVVDRNGRAVEDLKREEFQVYDNDVRRTIESFSVDDDQPLTVGVLIDESESQKDFAAEHRQTTAQLLERILRPGDRAFVVSVNEEARLWADWKSLEREAGAPFGTPCPVSACGSSPLWNAIYDAARGQFQPRSLNKALILLTDGFDSGSTHTWRQAADAAANGNTRIYALQYRSASGRDYAPDLYRLVADAGGAWFRERDAGYQVLAERIETDLRHRYVLGFRPEELSGKTRHSIRVEVTRPDLAVRARKTYVR